MCGELSLLQWLDKRFFLVGMVVAIALAAAYPDAGAKGGALQSNRTTLDEKLLKGLLISSCLPTTVSMCVVLTKTAGGNDAAAIFNAAFGNLLGIFVTPLSILLLVGDESSLALTDVLLKLTLKILVPLAVGQCVQYFVPGARGYYTSHKPRFKRAQESLLLW